MSLIGTPTENDVITAWNASMKDILNVKNQDEIPELNKWQCGTYKMHSLNEAHEIAENILKRGIVVINNKEIELDVEKKGLKKH